MVKETLVTFFPDAGRRVLEVLDKQMKITGAFWRYSEDGREWRLFLVTPGIDTGDGRKLYGKVDEALASMTAEERGDINTWRIYLMSPNSEVVKTMRQFHRSISEPPYGRYGQADMMDARPYVYRL